MPLYIYTEDVADEESCYDHDESGKRRRLTTLVEFLGKSGMWCGYSEITAENVEDVWARLDFYQRLNGAVLQQANEDASVVTDRPFTREDVEAHVGLRTNCSVEPFFKWVERITRLWIAKDDHALTAVGDAVEQHLDEICDREEIAKAFFACIVERESLTDEQILALDDEDVAMVAWEYAYPAVDQVERRLRAKVRA